MSLCNVRLICSVWFIFTKNSSTACPWEKLTLYSTSVSKTEKKINHREVILLLFFLLTTCLNKSWKKLFSFSSSSLTLILSSLDRHTHTHFPGCWRPLRVRKVQLWPNLLGQQACWLSTCQPAVPALSALPDMWPCCSRRRTLARSQPLCWRGATSGFGIVEILCQVLSTDHQI